MASPRLSRIATLLAALSLGGGAGASSAVAPSASASAAPAAAVTTSATAAPAVSTFPSPGSHVAWPRTQLSFRGVRASALGTIAVSGSRSGAHAGRLQNHSDGRGVSFLPDAPFAPGETVTVRTSLRLRGAKHGDYTLQIARPGPTLARDKVVEPPDDPAQVQHFHTRPDLVPPRVSVTHSERGLAPGGVFVAPKLGPGQNGPMILDPAGKLIWFEPLPLGEEADGFQVQELGGRRVLTWWQGYDNYGTGNGVGKILNGAYGTVAEVRAGNGYDGIDPHELRLTPSGSALVTIEAPVVEDLVSIDGAKQAVVFDSVVQELDVRTGLVLFEWHSLDHVGVAASYSHPPKRDGHLFDYFHINSVERVRASGDFLISARNTWSVYKVDRFTGAVDWTLGGKYSSFKMGRGPRFAWQHDARVQRNGLITIFDDGATPKVHSQSHGIGIRVNLRHKTARLVKDYRHLPALLSGSQGNLQQLANGNVFIGWGQVPSFTEYSSHGHQLFDAHLPKGSMSYRAFRFPWAGRPASKPDVVASSDGSQTRVYASWNGATEVVRWRVFAGPTPDTMKPVATVKRSGFETLARLDGAQAFVAVEAENNKGKALAFSLPVKPTT